MKKEFNSALLDTKKSLKRDKKFIERYVPKSARLYRAKVLKNGILLSSVFLIPGKSYHSFNQFLTPLFEKLPDANRLQCSMHGENLNQIGYW